MKGLDEYLTASPYDDDDEYDKCWETGEYTGLDCELCSYADECSGSDLDEED